MPYAPARRPILTSRDRAQRQNRDPDHITELTSTPNGPGLLPSPFNVPDGSNVPAALYPQAGEQQHPAEHLSPAPGRTGPDRDGIGHVVTTTTAGNRLHRVDGQTQTNAGAETILRWNAPVNHLILQNASGSAMYLDIDATANPGRLLVANGERLFLDVRIRELHLYTAAQQTINGDAAGGIYVAAFA